jgi:cytochrome oxidase Cu insertion factor (SCO1/SenC/PrrC family)/cytochrome c2
MLKTCLGAIAAACLLLSPAFGAEPYKRGADYFPNLPVVDQNGGSGRFYDDKIKGKTVVISFIYTSCQDICPLTTARMAQLEEKLGDAMGRDVFFYSMTVDPVNDTPEKMKKFAEAFGAGPGWQFLTGTFENIKTINAALGDTSKELYEHRNEIVIGNDVTGEWSRNNLFGDLDRLVIDVKSMDPEFRIPPAMFESNGEVNVARVLPDVPGQVMFKKICAPCHTVGVGDRVGPDLRGVTERRTNSWLTAFLKNPDDVRKKNDPVARELIARFPTVRMPKMSLTDEDAADMIAFLKGKTEELKEAEADAAASSHEHHGHAVAPASAHDHGDHAGNGGHDHHQH